jgi:hypothetical protein
MSRTEKSSPMRSIDEIVFRAQTLPLSIRWRISPLLTRYAAQQKALDETANALLREMEQIRQELERTQEGQR